MLGDCDGWRRTRSRGSRRTPRDFGNGVTTRQAEPTLAADRLDAAFALDGRTYARAWEALSRKSVQVTAWSKRVLSCDVIDNDTVRRLSDHGPVVLELGVGRG